MASHPIFYCLLKSVKSLSQAAVKHVPQGSLPVKQEDRDIPALPHTCEDFPESKALCRN